MNEYGFKRTPVYLQIRENIYNKIINGEYKAGDKLPSEEKLAEQFGVSRITVNKALMELVNKEYLTRIQGSGTFVSKIRKEGNIARGISFNNSLTEKGFKVTTEVLKKEIIFPSRDIAELLNISVVDPVLYLKRLRKVHNEPIVVQEAYLSCLVSKQLAKVDFINESLYSSLKDVCNQEIVCAKDVIEAKAADEDTARLLGIEKDYPVLFSRRLAYSKTEENPIELSYSIYRSDQYVLEVEYGI